MKRLVFVSPAWRRFEVTRVALAQRRHVCDVLAGRGLEATCLVVADDENLDVAGEYGFDALERPNEPLGAKFNDGLEHAYNDMQADYIVPIGSDDWIHEDVFDRLPDPHPPAPEIDGCAVWRDAPEIVTGRRVAVVELRTGLLVRCNVSGQSGTIPWIIPREALEFSAGRPVREDQRRGIDYSLMIGLRCRPNLVFHDPHDLCKVDFKSAVNMNTYETSAAALGAADEEPAWDALAERYPADLVCIARSLSESPQMVAA